MRCGFLGLYDLIANQLKEEPLSGDAFVFLNRSKTHLRCFVWDRTGFLIFTKRLENGRFKLRKSVDKLELDTRRLKLLMDGVKVGGKPA